MVTPRLSRARVMAVLSGAPDLAAVKRAKCLILNAVVACICPKAVKIMCCMLVAEAPANSYLRSFSR